MMSKIKVKTGLITAVFCLMVLSFNASAVLDPNIISSVTRVNGADAAPAVLLRGGLTTGTLVYMDRTSAQAMFSNVGYFGGMDYVQTAGADKNDPDVTYEVTLNKPGTLYLIIDNRVGNGTVSTNEPNLISVMTWVTTMGFTSTHTAIDIGVGSTPATIYALPVTAAGTITLQAQSDGTSRTMYVIAAAPSTWNLTNAAPVITGVASTVALNNTNTLTMSSTVTDDGIPATPGLSIQWTTVSTPTGSTVTYTPSATVASPTITLSAMGVYTIRVTASDGEKSISKTMVVTASESYSVTTRIGDGADAFVANDSKGSATSKNGTNSQLEVRRYDGTRFRGVYLRFDLSTVPAAKRTEATLSLNEYSGGAPKQKPLGIYGLVDETNDSWVESNISYSIAPGMVTPPLGNNLGYYAIDQYKLIKLGKWNWPDTTTGVKTSNTTDLYLDGFMARDTNQKVTLVIIPDVTDTSADWYLSSKEKTADPAPTLTFSPLNKYAKTPQPAWGATADIALTQLSWTNPTSSGAITCDVYFRQMTNDPNDDPNYASPTYGSHYTALATGISGNSVIMPALQRFKSYRWIVDIHDTNKPGTTNRGYLWNFNTNNAAPVVNAGPDQYVWRGKTGDPNNVTVNLTGTTSDDGYPNPPAAYTKLWTQVSGTAVTISPNNTDSTSVVLSATGTYIFRLTGDDSAAQTSDDVQIVVAETPCAAAKANPAYSALVGDLDSDCNVDINDLNLFVDNWLECSLISCN
jgi:hypothetical protein